jgi:hypothetical protein
MWVAARLLPHKEALALDQLKRGGYPTYAPRIRERRVLRRRVIEATPLLFPSYIFVEITAQWHGVRWAPGIANLVMDGAGPGRVGDSVIAELRGREINGLIELPPPLRLCDRVRVERGPLSGFTGLYAGQAPARACPDPAFAIRRGAAGCPARCGHQAPAVSLKAARTFSSLLQAAPAGSRDARLGSAAKAQGDTNVDTGALCH